MFLQLCGAKCGNSGNSNACKCFAVQASGIAMTIVNIMANINYSILSRYYINIS